MKAPNLRLVAKSLLGRTPFYPVHIGGYTRQLYFWKELVRLPVKEFRRVLDAGCGAGYYARDLATRYRHLEVVGLDVELGRAVLSVELPANLRFFQVDLRSLNDIGKYDFIYCIDVLDDVLEYEAILTRFHNALCSRGYLWIHLPLHPRRIQLVNHQAISDYLELDHRASVADFISEEVVASVLRASGFTILRTYYTFGYSATLAWELDRILDKYLVLKIALMPLLRTMARLDVVLSNKRGNSFAILCRKE